MLRRKTIRHFDEPGHAHELTFSCVHRLDLLLREQTREWLAQSIDQARKLHEFYLWAYVFMPNHVHLLIYPFNEGYSTQKILQSIKQPVGRRFMNRTRGIGGTLDWTVAERRAAALGRFWHEGPGYDRNVTEVRTATTMGEYIHRNPLRRGLVEHETDWYWSSARSWAGIEEGPIQVDKDSMPGH
jgi:putative transposase